MTKQILRGRCFRASPVFRGEIEELSGRYSDNKQRFDPSLIAGGVRCRFGGVQVLVCRPFSRKLRPFPTTFWLVCPYLVRLAGEVESKGGVRELEEFMTARNMFHEWRRYNLQHQVIRLVLAGKCRVFRKYHAKVFRSVMRSGIGGMKQTGIISVKCLHLQTASFLALGRHPGGEWLRQKGLCSDCSGARSCCRFCSPEGQG